MKTVLKNISFCLFSLFLITNIFIFTSCGDGNKNDEQIEKEDQCTYCQDEQYDNSCIDGSECNGKEIKYTHLLGNGNYQCRNFMVDEATGYVEDKAQVYLNEAKTYMNKQISEFENMLKGNSNAQTYFADYINNIKNVNYKLNPNVGMDLPIKSINNYVKPICVDIVKNISSPLNQKRMIRCYEAMTIRAKKDCYGNKLNADAQQEYEENKSWVIENWQGMHRVTGTQQPFDLGADMDNGFMQITEAMDTFLAEAAVNMGIPVEILRNFINQTFVIPGLNAPHDYVDQAIPHSCLYIEPIVKAMDEAAPLQRTNMVMNNCSI